MYKEKAVSLLHPQYEHMVPGWDEEKHHPCHTKEENDEGFQPLTKRRKIWSLKKNQNQQRLLNDCFKIPLFNLTGQIYLYVAQMFTIAPCTFIHRNECHSGKRQ